MKPYRYILEQYKGPASRHKCPGCNQPRQFTRYVDAETGEHVADEVGICNRSNRCGYHYSPKQYFSDHPCDNLRPIQYKRPNFNTTTQLPLEYLPAELVAISCRDLEANKLFRAFIKLVGRDAATNVFKHYRVGTSNHWPGATAFWQIDSQGRVRQCKIMLYDAETGKRVKDGNDNVLFAGKSILKNKAANLMQCFFGEHLLSQNQQMPVAIVESEKTAMFCSLHFPDLIWLATGGKQGCRWAEIEVCRALEGRTIILFPDLQATDLWKRKAAEIATKVKCRIHVSEDLEKMATDKEREQGLDLMDFLQGRGRPKQETKSLENINQIELLEPIKRKEPQVDMKLPTFSCIIKKEATTKQVWPVHDLEKQFIPIRFNTPIRLDGCTTIIDAALFIQNHFATIRANNGTKVGQPYYDRLIKLINQPFSKLD